MIEERRIMCDMLDIRTSGFEEEKKKSLWKEKLILHDGSNIVVSEQTVIADEIMTKKVNMTKGFKYLVN